MGLNKLKTITKYFTVATLIFFSAVGHAGLIFDTNGQIAGFEGVDYNGTIYNVAFDARPCTDIFDGCNETSDFFFNDLQTATDASAALAEAVFLGMTAINNSGVLNLSTILACGPRLSCNIESPYEDTQPDDNSNGSPGFGIRVAQAVILSGNPNVPASFRTANNTGVFAGFVQTRAGGPENVWAVWTEAPQTNPPIGVSEPSMLALLALSLCGLFGRKKFKK